MCVGEQPLHAVPLLQFHNKRRGATSNDFSIPHWINLSFYSSSKKIGYSTFLPRIKMAPIINKPYNKNKSTGAISSCLTVESLTTLLSRFCQDSYHPKQAAQSKTKALYPIRSLIMTPMMPKCLPCPSLAIPR